MTTADNSKVARFTPGPWKYGQESVDPDWFIVTIEGGLIVANVNSHWRQDANARLIAAAPELFEALQAVHKLVSEAAMTGFNCHNGDWAERLFLSQNATFSALSKVTGGATP